MQTPSALSSTANRSKKRSRRRERHAGVHAFGVFFFFSPLMFIHPFKHSPVMITHTGHYSFVALRLALQVVVRHDSIRLQKEMSERWRGRRRGRRGAESKSYQSQTKKLLAIANTVVTDIGCVPGRRRASAAGGRRSVRRGLQGLQYVSKGRFCTYWESVCSSAMTKSKQIRIKQI